MKQFRIRWGDVGAEWPVSLRAEATGTVLTGAHLASATLRVKGPDGWISMALTQPGASAVFPDDWVHVLTSEDFEKLPNRKGTYTVQVQAVKVGGAESRTAPTVGDLELCVGPKAV